MKLFMIAVALALVFAGCMQPDAPAEEVVGIEISGFEYTPSEVSIDAGTTVKWTNNDQTIHTVTGSGIDSGDIEPGGTFSHTFDETGTFSYSCTYHPSMNGEVIVG
jgi:plastocyanin